MRTRSTLAVATALVLAGGVAAAVTVPAPTARLVVRPAAMEVRTAPAPVPATAPVPPTAARGTVPVAPPRVAAHAPVAAVRDLAAYRGLGTWLDAFDWARERRGTTGVDAVDAMADRGVRTLYLQAAAQGVPGATGPLLSPDLLGRFLVRAHARGMRVQGWYLPTFADPTADRRALDAVLGFRADGQRFDTVGLDVEWRNGVSDVAERNRRLVDLSRWLRTRAGDLAVAAIVVAPVVPHQVNPDFWSPFPWAELAPLFDVWQPMGYWTDRLSSSPWSDAYRSTQADIHLLRRDLGRPDAPVHPIGGIGAATPAEAEGFVRAARDEGALGGSLYDWPTTPADRYPVLRGVPG